MTRAEYEQIRTGEVAETIAIRSDLYVDIDSDGYVLRVERIGDDVRYRDLIDVIEALVMPEESEEP